MTSQKPSAYLDWAYDRAQKLRAEGKLLREISEHVDIPYWTVQKWLKHGRTPRKTMQFTPEELTRAWNMLQNGLSLKDVGNYLGVSDHTAANYFPGLGWTLQERMAYCHSVRRSKGEDGLDKYV